MDLPEFHMKHLLQEEIEVILEDNFSLPLTTAFVIIFIFKPFWEAPVGSILIAEHDVDPQSLIHNKCAIALILHWSYPQL